MIKIAKYNCQDNYCEISGKAHLMLRDNEIARFVSMPQCSGLHCRELNNLL